MNSKFGRNSLMNSSAQRKSQPTEKTVQGSKSGFLNIAEDYALSESHSLPKLQEKIPQKISKVSKMRSEFAQKCQSQIKILRDLVDKLSIPSAYQNLQESQIEDMILKYL